MSAGQVATRRVSLGTSWLLALLGMVFLAGLAIGAGIMWITRGPAPAPEAVTRTVAIAPILDTGVPYLTIQDGVVVTPRRGASPLLDTSKPYTTIQNGVLVIPDR